MAASSFLSSTLHPHSLPSLSSSFPPPSLSLLLIIFTCVLPTSTLSFSALQSFLK